MQKDDFVDTEYDRWTITEIDNHQIIWVNLNYEFNSGRPSVNEEQEDDERDYLKDKLWDRTPSEFYPTFVLYKDTHHLRNNKLLYIKITQ